MLRSSQVTLYNFYGPTEASVYTTGKHVLRSELPGNLASIGKPLPNVACYVVDPTSPATAPLAPLLQPIGVWGELWLGGVQVARGYLKRPELTAERLQQGHQGRGGGGGGRVDDVAGDVGQRLADGGEARGRLPAHDEAANAHV